MGSCKILVSLKRRLIRVLFEQLVRILRTSTLPRHIAFVTDGNRTFAKKNGISGRASYVNGMRVILNLIEICNRLQIECITFFIFSSHNWKRRESDKEDVLAVIDLFLEKLTESRDNRRYQIIGDVSALPTRIRWLCTKLTTQTIYNDGILIILAINYSGRMEITDAVTKLMTQENCERITEQMLTTLMYTSDVVEPNLVIRSSGQRRLSDFLMWQIKTNYNMIHLWSTLGRNMSQWTFMVVLYICSTVAYLNVPTSPYAVITVDETDDNTLSEVSRRGYAGEDFYTKASKSIPRMGRRSNLDPLNCKSCDTNSVTEETNDINNDFTKDESNEILKIKLKRHNLQTPSEVSAWPWFRDHVPDVSKRNELADNCYYMPKTKKYISNNEICYDDLICCPRKTNSSVLKRYLSTYSPKQTTTISPDYKANRYM